MTGPNHGPCGNPGCMSPEMLDAFLTHFEAAVRQRVVEEYEAAERWKWAPTREWARRLVSAKTWERQIRDRAFPPARPVRQTPGWRPVLPGRAQHKNGLKAA